LPDIWKFGSVVATDSVPEKVGDAGFIVTLACPTTVPAGWLAATVLLDAISREKPPVPA